MPEILWEFYINFESGQGEFGNARNLHKRLLQRTQNVIVWISYAQFKLSIDSPDRVQKCRKIYEEANKCMSSCEEKEQRLKLLNSWKDFKKAFGSEDNMEKVTKLLPEKVKRRRMLTAKGGQPDEFWEEYYDYILPEDTANEPKPLSMAKMWKRQQETTAGETATGEKTADDPMLEETMSPPPSS